MFRRKEEGLFDNDMDQNQTNNDDAHDEKSASQQSSSNFANSSISTTSSSSAPSSQSAQRQATAPQPAGAFRPAAGNAAQGSSDLSRGRMPDAKQPATSVTASFSTPLPNPHEKNKNGKRVLTVGNDILLKGEIATCDRLVIEGKVDATLNDVHTVEIAECGSFKGSAQIEDAEISGLFEGELIVRGRLIIYATGKVRGKISYGEIEIERGGELTGEIKIAGATGTTNRPVGRAGANKDDRVAA